MSFGKPGEKGIDQNKLHEFSNLTPAKDKSLNFLDENFRKKVVKGKSNKKIYLDFTLGFDKVFC